MKMHIIHKNIEEQKGVKSLFKSSLKNRVLSLFLKISSVVHDLMSNGR